MKAQSENYCAILENTVIDSIEKTEDGYSYGYSKEYIYTKIDSVLNIGDIYDVIIDDTSDEVTGHVAE